MRAHFFGSFLLTIAFATGLRAVCLPLPPAGRVQGEPEPSTAFADDKASGKAGPDTARKLFLKIWQIASGHPLLKEAYHLAFIKPDLPSEEKPVSPEPGEKPFLQYSGKRIRKIKFLRLEVFGDSFNDTLTRSRNWLQSTANSLHLDTRQGILRSNLLFRSGDTLDPYLISNNEKALRALPFIRDARIVILSNFPDTSAVDLLVLTQDVWSIGFDVNIKSLSRTNFRLYDINLAGLGHHFSNTVSYERGVQTNVYYAEGLYRIPNIGHTFTSAEVDYQHQGGDETLGLKIDRALILPVIRTGGGIWLNACNLRKDLKFNDTLTIPATIRYVDQDYRLTRAIQLNRKQKGHGGPEYLMITGRFVNRTFHALPFLPNAIAGQYLDRTLVLATAGLSHDHYVRTSLVNDFGRTEDIPAGHYFGITVGEQYQKRQVTPYFDVRGAAGWFLPPGSYLCAKAIFGSLVRDFSAAGGVLGIKGGWFSPLITLKSLYFRNFINIDYINGISRNPGEEISLASTAYFNDLGPDSVLRGTQRLTVGFESNCFTPLRLLEFRFVFFAFANFGLIGPSNRNVFANRLYSNLGVGLRIRNDNLVFRTLQIRFAFFPEMPDGSNGSFFKVSGEEVLQFNDFKQNIPEMILYQ